MPTLINCDGYETGKHQGCTMTSNDFSDSYSIWHITCQMSAHTQPHGLRKKQLSIQMDTLYNGGKGVVILDIGRTSML
jgi:hypothetical protein